MNVAEKIPTRDEIQALARELAQRFAERAARHDADGSFPFENYEDIRQSGYPKLTVPVAYGGWGAGMLDAVMAQEILGMGDGSTALAITMHVQTVGAAAAGEKWDPQVFERLCRDIVERATLVNSCATEPELGSPSRGGRPNTKARRDGSDWLINGRKNFASMSPTLDYFIVPALIEEEDAIARFLVPRQPEVHIEETWDSLGMRSTGSHDIVLNDARVPDDMLISRMSGGSRPDPSVIKLNAWFTLTVSACYLGVAGAAHQTALKFAHDRVPTALGKPIATLESIQRRLGEAEMALQVARSVLYRAAEMYDAKEDSEAAINEAVLIAKLTATNNAIKIVDDAMRVAGGASMTHSLPLERYYRDVRAGLFHPPADDSAIPLLGRVALGKITISKSENET
ncbi:MAG: acyl-CoA/acyl-ACP dehydrogenase [Anaerolineae bacterium]|nr:acyl-CoA/acyl-ACP dehydrogenase [Anaerolineae bacterium]